MDKIVERVADRIEAVILVRTDLGSEDARRDFVRRQAQAAITETIKALAEDALKEMCDAYAAEFERLRSYDSNFDNRWIRTKAMSAALLSLLPNTGEGT